MHRILGILKHSGQSQGVLGWGKPWKGGRRLAGAVAMSSQAFRHSLVSTGMERVADRSTSLNG